MIEKVIIKESGEGNQETAVNKTRIEVNCIEKFNFCVLKCGIIKGTVISI